MTSQPDKAKYCPGTNHRIYAWRARQRELAAGIPLEGKFVTTRVVTD